MASLEKTILAVITTQRERVGGGVPIFYVKPEEVQRIGAHLEAILDAMVHELQEGLYIVVKHA